MIGIWNEEALFKVELLDGKSLLWWIGVGGSIVALCRSLLPGNIPNIIGFVIHNNV
jgi:hypothetical protein